MPADRLAFVVLLSDEGDALGLTRFLDEVCIARQRAAILLPPVRGMRFLADGASQEELDRWWAASVPPGAHPVYLMLHEEGLPEWLRGIDGTVYVGVPDEEVAARYGACGTVRATVAPDSVALAATVMRETELDPAGPVFDPEASRNVAALGAADVWAWPEPEPQLEPQPESLPAPPAFSVELPLASSRAPDPFDLLIQAVGSPPPAGPPPGPAGDAAGAEPDGSLSTRWHLPLGRPRRRSGGEAWLRELAAAAVDRGPTIVVIGSRKGGVGKTSHAAGVAIAAGAALDLVGHRAAIVDANIANPDAWGALHLPEGAATVREVVASLTAGADPPPPVHATSPALACFPEARDATEYSRTDINRLAGYLRRRYTLVVVDMSNRLPDPLAGPEAAAAAYWLEHGDVLVLPAASSKQDFNGVLDYLEVRGRPPTLVAYLVPNVRRNRDHPVARQYLEAIAQRVDGIIPIPDEADKVRYAGMEGLPVHRVSSNLAAAYRELTEAIVRVPPRPSG